MLDKYFFEKTGWEAAEPPNDPVVSVCSIYCLLRFLSRANDLVDFAWEPNSVQNDQIGAQN